MGCQRRKLSKTAAGVRPKKITKCGTSIVRTNTPTLAQMLALMADEMPPGPKEYMFGAERYRYIIGSCLWPRRSVYRGSKSSYHRHRASLRHEPVG